MMYIGIISNKSIAICTERSIAAGMIAHEEGIHMKEFRDRPRAWMWIYDALIWRRHVLGMPQDHPVMFDAFHDNRRYEWRRMTTQEPVDRFFVGVSFRHYILLTNVENVFTYLGSERENCELREFESRDEADDWARWLFELRYTRFLPYWNRDVLIPMGTVFTQDNVLYEFIDVRLTSEGERLFGPYLQTIGTLDWEDPRQHPGLMPGGTR